VPWIYRVRDFSLISFQRFGRSHDKLSPRNGKPEATLPCNSSTKLDEVTRFEGGKSLFELEVDSFSVETPVLRRGTTGKTWIHWIEKKPSSFLVGMKG